MKHSDRKHNKRWFLLLVCLALVCIGGAELIACRYFAPATFQRITAPVRTAACKVVDTGKSAATEVSAWWERITAPKPDLSQEEYQAATPPAIEHRAPILDPAITELVTENDVSILTGGILPILYFDQSDSLWSEQPYGSDDIGRYGCGPTAMAMAIRSLTGEETDPAQMAELAVSKGYWARGSGSYLSIVPGLAQAFGLQAQSLEEKTTDAMKDALLSGKLIVALMGPGHFTTSGHFILIRGITLSGSLLVADPNSREHSLQEWDAQLLLDELSTSTAHGAPLWTLEPASS